ncbi:MAG TPA: hypothetical protein VIO84_12935 [Candidatus Dormibacteraeota bacterium]|jgi:hypothetical protein
MDLRLVLYSVYILISVGMTIYVGRTLHLNGRRFLIDVMRDEGLADSVNHLLLVGFFLVNLGLAALLINTAGNPSTPADTMQTLVTMLGLVLLTLGGMHFGNLFVLHRVRRTTQERNYAEWQYRQAQQAQGGPAPS